VALLAHLFSLFLLHPLRDPSCLLARSGGMAKLAACSTLYPILTVTLPALLLVQVAWRSWRPALPHPHRDPPCLLARSGGMARLAACSTNLLAC